MKNTLHTATIAALALALASCTTDTQMENRIVPAAEQFEWQQMEYYMFAHFGPNTFSDKEWGDGTENPDIFDPTGLDCRQWAATAKAAGMKGIIITAKHHDGFCLWPSKYSTHTVRESRWRDGKGDVLGELSEACREYGLHFGVYISPWDRNHPAYGTDEYNEIYAATLREVLTGYGDIFELWLDGANGEGPGGKKQQYDWELFHRTIFECQPGVVVFSDIGPGCRWIGNEKGYAGETNWSRFDTGGFTPGLGAPPADTLNRGNIRGAHWVPGEADVSIRPGWFYSPSTDDRVKSVRELVDIYYGSVGRNANLLLNVPPDRRGRIAAADSVRLMEFRAAIEREFPENLAAGAAVSAKTSSETPFSIEVELADATRFDRLLLQEKIAEGQYVAGWRARYLDETSGEWREFVSGTTIGYKRLLRFDPVTARRIRLDITASTGSVAIENIELYKSAE